MIVSVYLRYYQKLREHMTYVNFLKNKPTLMCKMMNFIDIFVPCFRSLYNILYLIDKGSDFHFNLKENNSKYFFQFKCDSHFMPDIKFHFSCYKGSKFNVSYIKKCDSEKPQ